MIFGGPIPSVTGGGLTEAQGDARYLSPDLTGPLKFETVNVTDQDATPTVGGGNVFSVANTAPTTITNLEGGEEGQAAWLLILDWNTTIADGSGINTPDGQDFLCAFGEKIMLVHNGTDWDVWSRSSKVMHLFFAGQMTAANGGTERRPIPFSAKPRPDVWAGQANSRLGIQIPGVINRLTVGYIWEFGSDTYDRARLLLDGVEQWDSGTGLGITDTETRVFYPNIHVAAGNDSYLEVSVYKAGTNAIMGHEMLIEYRVAT